MSREGVIRRAVVGVLRSGEVWTSEGEGPNRIQNESMFETKVSSN